MKKVKETKVSEFLTVRNDRFKPSEAVNLGLKRIDKIDFSGNIYLSDKPTNTDMILARKGDLVISGINAAKGALAIYHGEEDVLATIHYSSYQFDEKKINIDYLQNFVKSPVFQHTLKQQVKGGMKTELKPKHILNLEIPLPSLAEQEAIVQKIKGFMATHSQAKAKIEALQTDLKAYRKSILQEAIKGNLTAAWRANNPTEKIDLKTLKKEATKKQKPLLPIKADEMPFALPQNWSWVRLGEIVEDIEAGSSPQCLEYPAEENHWGVIKMSAISWHEFRENENKKLPIGTEFNLNNEIKEGDFLMSRANTNELIAKSVIVRKTREKLLLNDKSLRVRFLPKINKEYINLYNNGEVPRSYYISKATGSSPSMKNISRDNIKLLPVPLPPLTEQAEIVRILEQKMATIAAAEEQLKALLAEQSLLQKSMMQEVFKG